MTIVLMRRAAVQTYVVAGVTLAMAVMLFAPRAQSQETESKNAPGKMEPELTRTFFLRNVTEVHDLNDITTDLRNMVLRAKIYAVALDNAITIRATAEDLQLAEKIIAELDRPKKVYRITFTINESDGGKKTGTQHYALVVTDDNKSYLKQGNRVPIVTGTIDKDTSSSMTQIQYLDVGVNIEAFVNGVGLHTKIEQTSIAEEKSNVGIQDPLVRQTTLEGNSTFVPGKAIPLGAIDVPGTSRHQDIEVVADLVQ